MRFSKLETVYPEWLLQAKALAGKSKYLEAAEIVHQNRFQHNYYLKQLQQQKMTLHDIFPDDISAMPAALDNTPSAPIDQQFKLGLCYLYGIGVEPSYVQAGTIFERIATDADGNITHADAYTHLALLYTLGRIGLDLPEEERIAKSDEYIKKLADQDNPDGLLLYGVSIWRGHAESSIIDPDERMSLALRYIEKADANNHPAAKRVLGILYHDYQANHELDDSRRNAYVTKAVKSLEAVVAEGDLHSHLLLAQIYLFSRTHLTGFYTRESRKLAAYELLKKATRFKGADDAHVDMGRYYHERYLQEAEADFDDYDSDDSDAFNYLRMALQHYMEAAKCENYTANLECARILRDSNVSDDVDTSKSRHNTIVNYFLQAVKLQPTAPAPTKLPSTELITYLDNDHLTEQAHMALLCCAQIYLNNGQCPQYDLMIEQLKHRAANWYKARAFLDSAKALTADDDDDDPSKAFNYLLVLDTASPIIPFFKQQYEETWDNDAYIATLEKAITHWNKTVDGEHTEGAIALHGSLIDSLNTTLYQILNRAEINLKYIETTLRLIKQNCDMIPRAFFKGPLIEPMINDAIFKLSSMATLVDDQPTKLKLIHLLVSFCKQVPDECLPDNKSILLQQLAYLFSDGKMSINITPDTDGVSIGSIQLLLDLAKNEYPETQAFRYETARNHLKKIGVVENAVCAPSAGTAAAGAASSGAGDSMTPRTTLFALPPSDTPSKEERSSGDGEYKASPLPS